MCVGEVFGDLLPRPGGCLCMGNANALLVEEKEPEETLQKVNAELILLILLLLLLINMTIFWSGFNKLDFCPIYDLTSCFQLRSTMSQGYKRHGISKHDITCL